MHVTPDNRLKNKQWGKRGLNCERPSNLVPSRVGTCAFVCGTAPLTQMSLGRGRASRARCQPSQVDGTGHKGRRLAGGSHGASDLDADAGTGADLFLGPSFVI